MIIIKKTPNADTRSMETLDKELVFKDTCNHIEAVKKGLNMLCKHLKSKAIFHDYTKIKYFDEFFNDLSTRKTGKEFKELSWWKKHLVERHHLNDNCPNDVNLLDVLEMVVDCVCAGKARSGEIYPIKLPDDLLQKALNNTVELVKERIMVE